MGCFCSCYNISETEQVLIQTLTTEEIQNGPSAFFCLGCLKSGKKVQASLMNEKQFIHKKNIKDGSLTLVKGPGLHFVKPYERVVNGIQDAISLKPDQYVKIVNQKSGDIRVERGEKLVFLVPFE